MFLHVPKIHLEQWDYGVTFFCVKWLSKWLSVPILVWSFSNIKNNIFNLIPVKENINTIYFFTIWIQDLNTLSQYWHIAKKILCKLEIEHFVRAHVQIEFCKLSRKCHRFNTSFHNNVFGCLVLFLVITMIHCFNAFTTFHSYLMCLHWEKHLHKHSLTSILKMTEGH